MHQLTPCPRCRSRRPNPSCPLCDDGGALEAWESGRGDDSVDDEALAELLDDEETDRLMAITLDTAPPEAPFSRQP